MNTKDLIAKGVLTNPIFCAAKHCTNVVRTIVESIQKESSSMLTSSFHTGWLGSESGVELRLQTTVGECSVKLKVTACTHAYAYKQLVFR